MKVTEIIKGYLLGRRVEGIRDFHGYVTPDGTSYNNYC